MFSLILPVSPYTVLPLALNCLLVSPYTKILRHYLSMDGGLQHMLVVTADGALWGCGSDYMGALGLHKNGVQGSPDSGEAYVYTLQKVVGPEFADRSGVLMAACGMCHSIVLANNHTVWVCGGTSSYLTGRYSKNHHTSLERRSLTLINPEFFGGRNVLMVAAGDSGCGAVTQDGDVRVWGGHSLMSGVDQHARIGRWHNLRQEHAVAFAMMFDKRLGANASPLKGLPADVLESMFSNMHLQPHADTPNAMHNMLGRRPPRRMFALDLNSPMLPDDEDEEYTHR